MLGGGKGAGDCLRRVSLSENSVTENVGLVSDVGAGAVLLGGRRRVITVHGKILVRSNANLIRLVVGGARWEWV